MFRTFVPLAAVGLALAGLPAFAQSPETTSAAETPSAHCWDVVALPAVTYEAMRPTPAILVNHCSGGTWMLIQLHLAPRGGREGHVWRWVPVTIESEEGVLSFGTPETEPKPKAIVPATGKR
jgi:hypothetical protein